MKNLLLAGVLAPALFAEISAFDAGNVELANPYGLTPSEKAALKNKQHLDVLSKEYVGVDFKTTKALERIDGMQTLLDDLGLKSHNLETRLNDFQEYIDTKDQAKSSEIAKLKNLIYANSKEISNLKKAISELVEIIESNQSTTTASNNPTVASVKINQSQINSKLSPAARLNSAIKEFENANYDAAAAEFEALASIRHKPALCNYYLAECAFAKNDFQRAIYHYKISSDLYKAQNVKPINEARILLHTAKSLEQLNQSVKAKPFYDALKQKFPNSAEAKSIN